jgi:hypothetical protein
LKTALGIFAALLITAGVAALVLWQVTHEPHLREIAFAAGITFLSAEVALLPMLLVRKTDPVVVFQAAFGGTVLHLFLTLAMGAVAHGFHWVDRGIFLFLLLGFYWSSLIFVVIAMIKYFRRSFPKSQPSAGIAKSA